MLFSFIPHVYFILYFYLILFIILTALFSAHEYVYIEWALYKFIFTLHYMTLHYITLHYMSTVTVTVTFTT